MAVSNNCLETSFSVKVILFIICFVSFYYFKLCESSRIRSPWLKKVSALEEGFRRAAINVTITAGILASTKHLCFAPCVKFL